MFVALCLLCLFLSLLLRYNFEFPGCWLLFVSGFKVQGSVHAAGFRSTVAQVGLS